MGIIPTFGVMVPMAASGTMQATWGTIWGALRTFPFLTKFLIIIGTCLVLWALIQMIMAKIRNRPMDTKALVWSLVIGTFLVFPNEIISLFLGIFDGAIEMIKKLILAIPKIGA